MRPEDYNISKELLTFKEQDGNIHDQKLDTKPIGYFKDAFNRFKKNKASIVASIIIIFLIIFAIIVPIFSNYRVSYAEDPQYPIYRTVLPKNDLFANLNIDFWDGCKETQVSDAQFLKYKAYAKETGNYVYKNGEYEEVKLANKIYTKTQYKIREDSYYKTGTVFKNLNVVEYMAIQKYQNETGIQVIYPMMDDINESDANIWYYVDDSGKPEFNMVIIQCRHCMTQFYKTQSEIEVSKDNKEIVNEEEVCKHCSHISGYSVVGKTPKDEFVENYARYSLEELNSGVYSDAYDSIRLESEGDTLKWKYARKMDGDTYKVRVSFYEYYSFYNIWKYNEGVTKPSFLFGTTDAGQDILTCLSSGARFSLILAVVVASVNLIVGAIIGAIEGYYGGAIDLIIERIIDILGSIPFMIVITLLKYHLNVSHVVILFISFFITGWTGMASRTRMQFYRFKNQEYVLVARTLGASDSRIMFKHIFPNAIGTLITSSVLVIPGVIFSETSLSYLGIINLESGNLISVGTLLGKGNTTTLISAPHVVLFPAIFISLLMLSFNLFGNGLRDAFNPSLRGTED